MADENLLDEIVEELNVEIPLFPSKQRRKFRKFKSLKKFIDNEVEYWEPLYGDPLGFVIAAFRLIQSDLQQAIKTSDQQEALQLVRSAVAEAGRSQSPLPYSETAMGKFLGELHARSPVSAESAYHYLMQGEIRASFKNRDTLDGLLLAFHFSNAAAFRTKIAATESSLTQLAENHQTVKDDLEQNADKLMAEIGSGWKTFSNDTTAWKKEFEDTTRTWRDGLQNTFDKGIQSKKEQFAKFSEECQQKVNDLENTFEEKLRLESPAKYWNMFADDYEKRGRQWRNWALGAAAVLLVVTLSFLAKPPSWFLASEFSAGSIRGTVLLAVSVSVVIYFIRLFVKLSTSAYHLSRDARERYQLTHVFLAMIKDAAATEEDRQIILQALFSRADTGLLKTDGGPTMPTGPLGSILGAIRGPH